MLTVENLSFAYDTVPVLKNISFTIQKGQHIALIGASGCGKSTLFFQTIEEIAERILRRAGATSRTETEHNFSIKVYKFKIET